MTEIYVVVADGGDEFGHGPTIEGLYLTEHGAKTAMVKATCYDCDWLTEEENAQHRQRAYDTEKIIEGVTMERIWRSGIYKVVAQP